jgi:hypothetical protein
VRLSSTKIAKFSQSKSDGLGRLFNPLYDPANEDGDGEPPEIRSDNLCSHVCLMIDTTAMDAILGHTEDEPGYVIAVDANNERSEQFQLQMDDEGTPLRAVAVPWDGTIMVHVELLFTEFYLRSIGENLLVMGEIHGEMGKVWSGV